MLIAIIAVVGSVCKPTATTAIIISAGVDCRYLTEVILLKYSQRWWIIFDN